MTEAQRGARLSSISLLVVLIGTLPASVWMFVNPGWMSDYMDAAIGVQDAPAEALGFQRAFFDGMMPSFVLSGLVFNLALMGGAAFAQWKLATRTIPIILLVWMGYTLIMVPVRLALPIGLKPNLPTWITIVSVVVTITCLGLNVLALRGAQAIYRLRQIP